jgi:TnpA family transposase
MSTIHETAYPRLKAQPTPQELAQIFTPSAAELRWARGVAPRSPGARLAILVLLKTFQRLGYFTPLKQVSATIVTHIAQAARIKRHQPLARYDTSSAKPGYLKRLRAYLQVHTLGPTGRTWLATVAETAAHTKQLAPDIINVMLEELVHHRYELPGFSTLERIALTARERVHAAYFRHIHAAISPEARQLIDGLLQIHAADGTSPWQALKREPRRPTVREVRFYLQHMRRIEALAAQLPAITTIPVPKLKYFRALARALDASELKDLMPVKRYALCAIFIRSQRAKTLDDAADLFIRMMQNLENTAQQRLIEHQLEHAERSDALIEQLQGVLHAYQREGTDQERLQAISSALQRNVERLLTDCDEHLAFAGKNYLPFLLRPYAVQRPLFLNCLEILQLKSTTQDDSLERMIGVVLSLRQHRRERLDLQALELDPLHDLRWLTPTWRMQVFGKVATSWVDRRYFELAVLTQVKNELKSGDLFIKHAERYDDYREQLVDEESFTRELPVYEEVSGIATDPQRFVQTLREGLTMLARTVDERFPQNAHADIVEGRLILRRAARAETPAEVRLVDQRLSERLPPVSILDVLTETTHWLGLHRHFRPLAGTDSHLEELLARVVITVFCFGCNLGPVQTARSIRGFSRRQIAWLNLKYVTEETLERAIADIINAYNKFELPRYWGSGKSASADGTKWNVYEQNLLSEYHLRYGGYGGIGYYHVSDKYIALFSHFIPCGVHEAIYILDGLLANTSDIQPEIMHGDTHAQSYPVFALAHLLGIQLMPRIRNIKELIFFRPHRGHTYQNIQALFGEVIDWKLIATHLHDMLRVAVSIKLGKITSSTILRRLGTYSRKNKLYFAFRELGKVIRTQFLLRYIDDAEVRQTIHAATNKSEEFNGFVKWAFFGGEGIIAENVMHEQRKIVKYNQLVANLIILHNVERMTRVLTQLRDEGVAISAEVLRALSPYRTGHINRFGDYTLDVSRAATPVDYATPIL